MTEEDQRLTRARALLEQPTAHVNYNHVRLALANMLDYADERLRVNVGLVAENAELRRRLREPEPLPDDAETRRALLYAAMPELAGFFDALRGVGPAT